LIQRTVTEYLTFEQGPIRPPSESRSLCLRFTRNCRWNRCTFCLVYKDTTFSPRSLDEIKNDIDAVAALRTEVMEYARQNEPSAELTRPLLRKIFRSETFTDYHRRIAVWFHYGTFNIFLQDSDALAIETGMLSDAITYLRERIPDVDRITTYGRTSTIHKKSLEELKHLKDAGLDRIHVGLETGYDPLLKKIKKGATSMMQVETGKKVKNAGLELSLYVMPGLGGKRWSREHALSTADVINRISPDFIRLRTLCPLRGTELADEIEAGSFKLFSPAELIDELHLFVSSLQGITSYLASDHVWNPVTELEGRLPEDKESMLELLTTLHGE